MDGTHYYGDGCPEHTIAHAAGVVHAPEEAHYRRYDLDNAEETLTKFAGLDKDTDHGRDTPLRFLAMLDELTQCKNCNGDCIKWKDFPAETDEMIICEKLPFVSVCNHHVVPFRGEVHIAYVPGAREGGLSKFGRAVEHFSRQLQVQERLTADIADWLESMLQPSGIGVVVRAEHMCMTIRGLRAPGAYTTTSAMRGVFADHSRTAKAEFLSLVNSNGRH